jgi:hypothetical protein
MDTNATNGIENTEVDLVDERTLDKPTSVEQNGGNGQHTASEQVFEKNTNSSPIEAQTDNINDTAQSLKEGNTQNADSQSLITRPKRQTKASLKSVQNRMQTKEFKTTKSWDKVQSGITTLQTMPDSIPQIRFAISKVHAAFHDCHHMSIVEVCKSDPNPIGFVRISEPKYSFRIGLIKLFRSRIGLRYPK